MPVQQVCVLYATRVGGSGVEVLLGRKRTGLGIGKVVAPGGKLQVGEPADEAVLRELVEEVGPVRVSGLREVGLQEYRFPSRPAWHQDSHVFVARFESGEVTRSDELDPFWVRVEDVPYDQMWNDARLWLPQVLHGGACGGRYTFGDDLSSVVEARPISEDAQG